MNIDKVKNVLVAGFSVRGNSIAQILATSGIKVGLIDINEKVLEHSMNLIESNLNRR